MDIPRIDFLLLFIVGAAAVIEIVLLARHVQLRYVGLSFGNTLEMRGTGQLLKASGRNGVKAEIEKLRAGGEIDNDLINNLSQADRVLFEVAVIDALTKWTAEEQARLRRALVRYGFDEQCSRRLLRGDLSGHVRASTILGLLRTP